MQIYIDDPLNVNNNVGKSAFRYQHIRVSALLTMQSIFNMTYNSAFLGCSCRYILPSTKHQLNQPKTSESAFQQAPANYMEVGTMMSHYSNLFHTNHKQNQESIIAKLIYSYVQY